MKNTVKPEKQEVQKKTKNAVKLSAKPASPAKTGQLNELLSDRERKTHSKR